ncbi:protein NRT1/ PTR FAMILY 5.4 isoform X2 [Fagus crenata]
MSISIIPLHYRKAVFFVALYISSVGEEAGGSSIIVLMIFVTDNVRWAAGFGMLGATLAMTFLIFLLGSRRYQTQRPLGIPLTTVVQVIAAAVRKWRLNEVHNGLGVYYGDETGTTCVHVQCNAPTSRNTNQFRSLDKAMIIDKLDAACETRNPWRLCPLNQVEEVKLILRLNPIWLSCIMYPTVQSQLRTYFTKQNSRMFLVASVTAITTVPIYDRVFIPIAQKLTGHPSGITVLQRIGFGLFLSILNMVVSALVEAKRISIAREHKLLDHPKAIVPIIVWWMLPQYMLCGLSEVFAFVGRQQLFYEQTPETMRSLGEPQYNLVLWSWVPN